jgi:hypothetical protein
MAIAPSAEANIQVKLKDLSYEPCPAEQGKNLVLGGGVMPADCYTIKGTAVNTSGKVVYNADIFGRVYDANGNDVMPERGRLGSIDMIPVGESPFEIMLSVPRDQPPPLTLKQFKASGFSGSVRR